MKRLILVLFVCFLFAAGCNEKEVNPRSDSQEIKNQKSDMMLQGLRGDGRPESDDSND